MFVFFFESLKSSVAVLLWKSFGKICWNNDHDLKFCPVFSTCTIDRALIRHAVCFKKKKKDIILKFAHVCSLPGTQVSLTIINDVIVDDVEPTKPADKPEPEVDIAPPTSDGGEDLPRPEEGPTPCE